jgi:hypothetical protein
MDEPLVDEVAVEVEEIERELDQLRFATPWNDVHAAKLAYRREVLERHLARLKALA